MSRITPEQQYEMTLDALGKLQKGQTCTVEAEELVRIGKLVAASATIYATALWLKEQLPYQCTLRPEMGTGNWKFSHMGEKGGALEQPVNRGPERRESKP